MAKHIDWQSHIGRRIRLRDLHVLMIAVACGSMAKAATQLGVTQSAVSQVIGDIEHVVGAKLLERSRQGIEPTMYGAALLSRAKAAFDELRQGMQEIEFLSDPAAGEIRVGSPEAIAAAILPMVVRRFSQEHPRALIEIDTAVTGATSAPKLYNRELDVIFSLGGPGLSAMEADDELHVEVFFRDELVIAAGAKSEWAHRRKVSLDQLAEAPWIVSPYGRTVDFLPREFAERATDRPNIRVKTFSVHVRANLLATGPFVTALPKSVFEFYGPRLSLKALPIELPSEQWPIAMVTLKRRVLSPVVERFIACARAVGKAAGTRKVR